MASVGVCTRPSDTTPPTHARPRIVAARVAFIPTSQSASLRELAEVADRPRDHVVVGFEEVHVLAGSRARGLGRRLVDSLLSCLLARALRHDILELAALEHALERGA